MRNLVFTAIFFAAMLAFMGCQMPRGSDYLPNSRPLASEHITISIPSPANHSETASNTAIDLNGQDLTLEDAIALALQNNIELVEAGWDLSVGAAEVVQAGLMPNPEIEMEFENVAGTGEFSRFGALETTIALTQPLELGNKRTYRVNLANAQGHLLGWDFEAKRLEIVTQVTQAFIDLQAAQDAIALAEQAEQLAQQAADAIDRMVQAGSAAPPNQARAMVAVRTAQLDTQRAHSELEGVRQGLAILWNNPTATFGRAVGTLTTQPPRPPALEQLQKDLAESLELARLDDEIAERYVAINLANAEAVPDINLTIGYRNFQETEDNDHAFFAGVSVPLPIFNRNQGAITQAQCELYRTQATRRGLQAKLEAELQENYRILQTSYAESTALHDDILPAAQQAFESIQQAFIQGRSDYLSVLDAQQEFIELKYQYVQSLQGYGHAKANIERLIGRTIN